MMMDFNKVIAIDYRGFLINVNINQYFRVDIDSIDSIDYSKLNLSKLSHQKQFVERIEDMVITIELDKTI